jgi:hypothetical protein
LSASNTSSSQAAVAAAQAVWHQVHAAVEEEELAATEPQRYPSC